MKKKVWRSVLRDSDAYNFQETIDKTVEMIHASKMYQSYLKRLVKKPNKKLKTIQK